MRVSEALMREPSPSLVHCELTFVERASIDPDRASLQHRAYRDALKRAGFHVTVLPSDPECPDAVFVEDPAIVLDEAVVLTNLGTPTRRGEGEALLPWFEGRREVVRLEPGLRLEGGDVLRIGSTFFVGRSRRTDDPGIDAFEDVVNAFGHRVVRVDVTGCLHLKTGVTALDDETVLANPAWVDLEPFAALRVQHVHATEPFAANVVRAGARILASASWPRTADAMSRLGFELELLSLSEFEKAEGGATCLSLLLPTPHRAA